MVARRLLSLAAALVLTGCAQSTEDPKETQDTSDSSPSEGNTSDLNPSDSGASNSSDDHSSGSNATTSANDSSANDSTTLDDVLKFVHSEQARDQNPGSDPTQAALLIAENHQLAAELFASQDPTKNLALSPISLQYAFALLQTGAAGQTKQDLAKVLTHSSNLDALQDELNALDLALSSRNTPADDTFGEVALRFANAMFARHGFNPGQDYLDRLAKHFGAGLFVTDFAGHPDQALLAINQWVETQTNQRIMNLLSPNEVAADTVFQLVNATYFKSPWVAPFPVEKTAKADFYVQDGSVTSPVDMMDGLIEDYATYAKLSDERIAVELALGRDDMNFGIVVPPRGGFSALAASVSPSFFTDVQSKLTGVTVHLRLPKFKVQFGTASFLDFFSGQQGLKNAFIHGDYSAMVDPGAPTPDFAITNVSHQAFVAIDEIGVEAAAASSVGSTDDGSTTIEEVLVDRPFIFYIRDRPTNTILFVGQVTTP